MGRGARHITGPEEHAAVIGCEVAGHAVEERRLARTVGPDEAHQLAGLDAEVHAVQGRDPEKPLDQPVDLEQRHQRATPGPAGRRSNPSMPPGERITMTSSTPP